MGTRSLIFTFFSVLFMEQQIYAQSLNLGPDIEHSSRYIEISPVEPFTSLLASAGYSISDNATLQQANTVFSSTIQNAMPEFEKNNGLLLKVPVYERAGSNYIVPNGELFLPISFDQFPSDAISSYFLVEDPPWGLLERQTADGLDDQSFYIWVQGDDQGVTARTIEAQHVEGFQSRGRVEAARRRELNQFTQSFGRVKNTTVRAEYWSSVYEETRDFVSSVEERQRITSKLEEFSALQREANKALVSYYSAYREVEETAAFWKVLDGIEALANIVSGAIRAGNFISDNFGSGVSDDSVDGLETDIEQAKQDTVIQNNYYFTAVIRHKSVFDKIMKDMERDDKVLEGIFKRLGVDVQEFDRNLIPNPPESLP